MKKQTSLLVNSDSDFKITLNPQNHDFQKNLPNFEQDFKDLHSLPINEGINYLAPSTKFERRTSKTKSKTKKRMKLIDYIHIKNSSKKNQFSKIQKLEMPLHEVGKYRMKDEKQKAFKAIVDQLVDQLKQLSVRAASISQIVDDKFVYTGATDEIAMVCNLRRMLKSNILENVQEFQKLVKTQNPMKTQQKEEETLYLKLKNLQSTGVKNVKPGTERQRIMRLNSQIGTQSSAVFSFKNK